MRYLCGLMIGASVVISGAASPVHAQDRQGPCFRIPPRDPDDNSRFLEGGVTIQCDVTGSLAVIPVGGGNINHTGGDLVLSLGGTADSLTSSGLTLTLSGSVTNANINGSPTLTGNSARIAGGNISSIGTLDGASLSGRADINGVTTFSIERLTAASLRNFDVIDDAILSIDLISDGALISNSTVTANDISEVDQITGSRVTTGAISEIDQIRDTDITADAISDVELIADGDLRTTSITDVNLIENVSIFTDAGLGISGSFSVDVNGINMSSDEPAGLAFSDIDALTVGLVNAAGVGANGFDGAPSTDLRLTDVGLFDIGLNGFDQEGFRVTQGDVVVDLVGVGGTLSNGEGDRLELIDVGSNLGDVDLVLLNGAVGSEDSVATTGDVQRGDLTLLTGMGIGSRVNDVSINNVTFDFSQAFLPPDAQGAGALGLSPNQPGEDRTTVSINAGTSFRVEDLNINNASGGAIIINGEDAQDGETRVDATINSDFFLADGREFLIVPGVFLNNATENVITFGGDVEMVVEDGAFRAVRGQNNEISFAGVVLDQDRPIFGSDFAATNGAFVFNDTDATTLNISGEVVGGNAGISFVNSLGIGIVLTDDANVSATAGPGLRVVDTDFAPELTTDVDNVSARLVTLDLSPTEDPDRIRPTLTGGENSAGALFGPGRDVFVSVEDSTISGGRNGVGIEVTDRDATGAIPTTRLPPFFVTPQPGSFSLNVRNDGAVLAGDPGGEVLAVQRSTPGVRLDLPADGEVFINVGGAIGGTIGGVNNAAITTSAGASADRVVINRGIVATGGYQTGPDGTRVFVPFANEVLDDFFTPAINLGTGDDRLEIIGEDARVVGGVALGGAGLFPSRVDDFTTIFDAPITDVVRFGEDVGRFEVSVLQPVVEGQISANVLSVAGTPVHNHGVRLNLLDIDIGGNLLLSSGFVEPVLQEIGAGRIGGTLEVSGRGFVAGGLEVTGDLHLVGNESARGEPTRLRARQGVHLVTGDGLDEDGEGVDFDEKGLLFGRGVIEGDLFSNGGSIFLGNDLSATNADSLAAAQLDLDVIGNIGLSSDSRVTSLFTLSPDIQHATRLDVTGAASIGGELVMITDRIRSPGDLEVLRASEGIAGSFGRVRIIAENAADAIADVQTGPNNVTVSLIFNGEENGNDDGGDDDGGDPGDDGGIDIVLVETETFRADADERELDDLGDIFDGITTTVADGGEDLLDEFEEDEDRAAEEPEEVSELIPPTVFPHSFDPEGRVADVVATIQRTRAAVRQSEVLRDTISDLHLDSLGARDAAVNKLFDDALTDLIGISSDPVLGGLIDQKSRTALTRVAQIGRSVGTGKSVFDLLSTDPETAIDLAFVVADATVLINQARDLDFAKRVLPLQGAVAGLRVVSNLTKLGLADLTADGLKQTLDELDADIERATFKQAQLERDLLTDLAVELGPEFQEAAAFVTDAESEVDRLRTITTRDLSAVNRFHSTVVKATDALFSLRQPTLPPLNEAGNPITLDGVTLPKDPPADVRALFNSMSTLGAASQDVSAKFSGAKIRDVRVIEAPSAGAFDEVGKALAEAHTRSLALDTAIAKRLGLTPLGDGAFMFASFGGGAAFDERGPRDNRTIAFGPTVGLHLRHYGGVVGSYALSYRFAERRDFAAAQSADIHTLAMSASWVGNVTDTERARLSVFGGGALTNTDRAGGAEDTRFSLFAGGEVGLMTGGNLTPDTSWSLGGAVSGRLGHAFASTASDGVRQGAISEPSAAVSLDEGIEQRVGGVILSANGGAGYELTDPGQDVERLLLSTSIGAKGALSETVSVQGDLTHRFAPGGGFHDISANLRLTFRF